MMVVGTFLFTIALMIAMRAKVGRLKDMRLRFEILLPVGLAIQVAGPQVVPDGPLVVISWMAGAALVLVMAVANRAILGFQVIFLGVILNSLVILLNGGMPVSVEALHYVGADDVEAVISAASPLYSLADSGTMVLVLGDVVPVPGPAPIKSLISLGDLLLMIGVVVAVLEVTKPRSTGELKG